MSVTPWQQSICLYEFISLRWQFPLCSMCVILPQLCSGETSSLCMKDLKSVPISTRFDQSGTSGRDNMVTSAKSNVFINIFANPTHHRVVTVLCQITVFIHQSVLLTSLWRVDCAVDCALLSGRGRFRTHGRLSVIVLLVFLLLHLDGCALQRQT